MQKFLLHTFGILSVVLFVLLVRNFIVLRQAEAATSYFVNADEPMYLTAGIDEDDTTGIILTGPVRNNRRMNFRTLTGGILEFASSERKYSEYIYYSSATIDSTSETKNVTLAGVVRGYCWSADDSNISASFASCETGRDWPRGTKAVLVNAPQLYNFSPKLDKANTFLSGASITGNSTVNALFRVPEVTTAQRDAFYTAQDGDVIYNGTTDEFNGRRGNAWTVLGGSGTTNATITIAGKVEIGTGSDIISKAATGTTGAVPVIPASLATRISNGRTNSGYVMALSGSGVCDVSLGCTGTGTTSMGSGALLRTQGRRPMKPLYPGTDGNVVTSNGTEFVMEAPTTKLEAVVTAAASGVGGSSTTETTLVPTWTGTGIDAATLAVGSLIKFEFGGTYRLEDTASDDLIVRVRLAGQECLVLSSQRFNGTTSDWFMHGSINVRSIGASGSLACGAQMTFEQNELLDENAADFGTVTVNTNNQIPITITARYATSNANHLFVLQTGSITVHSQ